MAKAIKWNGINWRAEVYETGRFSERAKDAVSRVDYCAIGERAAALGIDPNHLTAFTDRKSNADFLSNAFDVAVRNDERQLAQDTYARIQSLKAKDFIPIISAQFKES